MGDDPHNRISVSVIGGYLGSGKTTLVNHLLRHADERIAVLVNDFGDINIDLDLIQSSSDDTIELSNGCICCSMIDGFSEALDRVLEFDPPPDRLVIEASGVADPGTVAAYGHGPGLELDAVIVLADAETVRRSADDKYVGQTIRMQLGSGDIVVVNKADLVSPDELDEVVAWVREGWPDAYLLTATESRLPTEVLFGRPSALAPGTPASHHHPERLFATYTIERSEPLSRDAVAAMMDELADSVVRAKGLVLVEGDLEQPHVLQRVGRRWTLRSTGRPWPGDPATQIVVIEAQQGDD